MVDVSESDPKTAAEKTRVILELLRHRHEPPEWATFVELATGTGARSRRYIDFFAFNLWPSKRYRRVAYEIKVSRSDFFREVEDPDKRRYAERYAHECYFATPYGLVQPDEVPAGWGLIELLGGKGGLRVRKRAQQSEFDTEESLPVHFVASLARQSSLDEPDLPAVAWMWAGQELDEEQLLEAAGESMEAIRHRLRLDVKDELMRTGAYQNMARIQSVVKYNVGWAESRDPDRLKEWFERNGLDQEKRLRFNLRNRLESVRAEIDELLEQDRKARENATLSAQESK